MRKDFTDFTAIIVQRTNDIQRSVFNKIGFGMLKKNNPRDCIMNNGQLLCDL